MVKQQKNTNKFLKIFSNYYTMSAKPIRANCFITWRKVIFARLGVVALRTPRELRTIRLRAEAN